MTVSVFAQAPPPSGVKILALVEFRANIDIAQQDAIERAMGATFFRPVQLVAQHVIVETTAAGLAALAARGEVAGITTADPDLLGAPNASNTAAPVLAQPVLAQVLRGKTSATTCAPRLATPAV